jgi:hypothetical protein
VREEVEKDKRKGEVCAVGGMGKVVWDKPTSSDMGSVPGPVSTNDAHNCFSWTKYRSAQDNFNVWFGSPVQSYHPGHDRRHQINSMASLYLGKYTVGIRWQMGTGLPFTRQMGHDGVFMFDEGLPNIKTDYGTPRVILDKPFKGRTPTYHRLDISLEREFEFNFGSLIVQAGAINTYNRVNLFYYDVFTQRRIDQLPFAPYGSLKMEF